MHPQNTQFDKFLAAMKKDELKALNFNKWRSKLPEGEDKTTADELWAKYEARKTSMQAVAPKSALATHAPAPAGRGHYQAAPQLTRADNAGAGNASVLKEPFHNPYTFIPFATKPPIRRTPTPVTIDEDEGERGRFTGILDMEIKLLSPLLTSDPDPNDLNGHRIYKVQAIGDDVIVPATGVRGALRSLMSLLTGGTLGHVDEEAWLCQGRDARLGPAAKASKGQVPDQAFLAEIVEPGSARREGKVRLGRTKLLLASDLESTAVRCGFDALPRPRQGDPPQSLWSNETGSDFSRTRDESHPWRVKLSGRPVNPKGKREGLFLAGGDDEITTLPTQLWSAFLGRYRHADKQALRRGDLVWLQPKDLNCNGIDPGKKGADVKSIQWARWGREGESLLKVVADHHRHLLPDEINPDGLVDEVTDLFGQVPRQDLVAEVPGWEKAAGKPAGAFASRLRLGNLIFPGARQAVQQATLAPLQPPHPGCAAFYRTVAGCSPSEVPDLVSNHGKPLRGYKVYRTTVERGETAPWLFRTQAVYGDDGQPKPPQQKVNKTVQLLPEGQGRSGRLRLALRALSEREVALVLAACSVDWRLGGGKPLGLGHCRVTSATLRSMDDDGILGAPVTMIRSDDGIAPQPAPYAAVLAKDAQLLERLRWWQLSQQPVKRLRYPRAVVRNHNKLNRGGHAWFGKHAAPRQADRDGEIGCGLRTIHLEGELRETAQSELLSAQPLPAFDPDHPQDDVLYGHDLLWETAGQERNRANIFTTARPFTTKEIRGTERSGGPQGQTRDTRESERKDR